MRRRRGRGRKGQKKVGREGGREGEEKTAITRHVDCTRCLRPNMLI